jgi:membrane protease subunit HflC
MKANIGSILVGLVVLLIIGALSLFVVDQRQNAIVFRLGEVVDIKRAPGLYFKLPLVDNVRNFDVRILTIDTAEPERFLTSEKKNVLVDLFVKWRIADVRQYYASIVVSGGGETQAQTRLLQTINDGLRAEFGNRTVHDVISGERDKIMDLMRERANEDAKTIGVEVLDVRLKRVDLPQEVSDDVYRRMNSERARVAKELRSTGGAESEKIRADGDKQREVIIAQAYRDLRQCLWAESRVLRFLSQSGSLQGQFSRQERRAVARAQLRVLQVPEVEQRQGGQVGRARASWCRPAGSRLMRRPAPDSGQVPDG